MAHEAPQAYNHITTLGQLLDLPVRDSMSFVHHVKGSPFQDECKPYMYEHSRTSYATLADKSPTGRDTYAFTTMGVQWDKLHYPKNGFVLSIIAQQGSYFVPKGQSRENVAISAKYLMNPTPTSLHECTHVEVAITDYLLCRIEGAPIVMLNPNLDDDLKSFSWCNYWDKSSLSAVAGFVPCEVVQQIADDLCDVVRASP